MISRILLSAFENMSSKPNVCFISERERESFGTLHDRSLKKISQSYWEKECILWNLNAILKVIDFLSARFVMGKREIELLILKLKTERCVLSCH